MAFTFSKEVEVSTTQEVNIELDADEMAEEIYNECTQDEAIELINKVDEHFGDWDFTEKLIKHFYALWREEHPDEDLVLSDTVVKGKKEDEEEDEEEVVGEEKPAEEESHSHVYRQGQCYCGAVA